MSIIGMQLAAAEASGSLSAAAIARAELEAFFARFAAPPCACRPVELRVEARVVVCASCGKKAGGSK